MSENPVETPQLPPGWEKVDGGDGDFYYWNTDTNETTWDAPGPPAPTISNPPPPPAKPSKPPKPRRAKKAQTDGDDYTSRLRELNAARFGSPVEPDLTSLPTKPTPKMLPIQRPKQNSPSTIVDTRQSRKQITTKVNPKEIHNRDNTNDQIPRVAHTIIPRNGAMTAVPKEETLRGMHLGFGVEPPKSGVTRQRGSIIPISSRMLPTSSRRYPQGEYLEEGSDENRLRALQILCGESFIFFGKRLLKEGALSKRNRDGIKAYHFVLLSSELLYLEAAMTTETFQVHHAFPLGTCRITMGTNEPDEDSKLAFTIRNPTKSFVVEAEEENEMRQWFDLIQAQIKSTCAAEEKPVDPHNITFAPVWLSNSAVKNCQICDRQFTLIKRRHHCRSCGKVVCGTCSNEKIRLQNIHESKFVRACTICYEENKKTRTYGVNTYAHQATSKDEVARLQAATPDVASSVAITPKSTDTIETPSMLPRYTSPQSLPSVALEQPTEHISKISSTSEATELVVTLFQYVSTEDGDLSLEVGEKIKVTKREVGGDENWMEGESARTGETGIFPASYVETVPAVATSSPLPISSSGASCVASTTGNVYSLAALKQDDLPFGVDKDRKEEYLSDGDFEQVFEMSKSSFQKLAKWQKSAKKKAVGLF